MSAPNPTGTDLPDAQPAPMDPSASVEPAQTDNPPPFEPTEPAVGIAGVDAPAHSTVELKDDPATDVSTLPGQPDPSIPDPEPLDLGDDPINPVDPDTDPVAGPNPAPIPEVPKDPTPTSAPGAATKVTLDADGNAHLVIHDSTTPPEPVEVIPENEKPDTSGGEATSDLRYAQKESTDGSVLDDIDGEPQLPFEE